jgi:hypothetical protein
MGWHEAIWHGVESKHRGALLWWHHGRERAWHGCRHVTLELVVPHHVETSRGNREMVVEETNTAMKGQ